MYEHLQIGEIVNIHGVKGEIKVYPLTDDPTRYEKLKWFYIDQKGKLEKHKIENVKYFKNMVILKLEGIDDPDQAEALKGSFILIDRKDAVKLSEDSYFICDLIGMQVQDDEGKVLGNLNNVLQTGSNDVYVVRNESGQEILIPALKSVVLEISIQAGIIKVKLPVGLIDEEI
jgi:16S rRNA processing protein RimM